MFDPEDVPLITSEGRRPSSTAGDRLMVGLAALALVGGVVIAVSRFMPEQTEQPVSQATATPSPTAEGTPRPGPTLRNQPVRTMQVDTAFVPSPRPSSAYVGGWVRMKTDVTLLISPSSSIGNPAGVLRRGDAAHVYQAPESEGGEEGWLQVETPLSGWIFSDFDNDAMFEHFPDRWRPTGSISSLAANPYGFTGSAWSTEGGELTLASADGVHWQTASSPIATWGRSVAYGPAGLLMVANGDNGGSSISVVSESPDGRSWQPIGMLPQEAGGGGNVIGVAGSDAGYVLLTWSDGGQSGVWFSADGLLWTERPLDMARADGEKQVAATPLGFVVWTNNGRGDTAGAAFSTDGWTWSEASFPAAGQVIDVVADGDHLLALASARDGGQIWQGTVDQDELSWADTEASAFTGAALSSMVSDGERVIVLGWDRATEAPLWWELQDGSWRRRPMPDGFEGLPREAAGGPQGIVVVDQSDIAGVNSPVIWHLGAGSRWEPEPSPLMTPLPPPTRRDCGPVPDDILALLSMEGTLAADCFGDTPITIRGWTVPCDGCYERGAGTWETAWLASPEDDQVVHLSPMENSDWGSFDSVLAPSFTGRPPRTSRWLEVTGHFDDPAAASCRWRPTALDEQWYSGTADIVAGCRGRFVVTSVRGVKGP